MDINTKLLSDIFDTTNIDLSSSYIFDENTFVKFITNLLNLSKQDKMNSIENIVQYPLYRDYVYSYRDIAKYKDENRNTIIVTIIKLVKGKNPEKARSIQRNFIAQHLEDTNSDSGIAAIYSETEKVWRISFVKTEQKFTINGIETEITPTKRYSYLIEPNSVNHTAQSQFRKLLISDYKKPNMKEIEEIFSIEKVTTEFFKQYKEKYSELKLILKNDKVFKEESLRLKLDIEKFADEFAKKLMGQISFLYFLQKKGWLGVRLVPNEITFEEFDPIFNEYTNNKEIQSVLKKVYAYKDGIFRLGGASLKKLTAEEQNKLASVFGNNKKYEQPWGSGDRKFIRTLFERSKKDKNFFNDYLEPLFYNALNKKRDKYDYFAQFNCKIPFLNGGLFEAIQEYDWQNAHINIPNDVFSNEKNEGILDFFDMYNFTMSEDEPLEKEVAVDPEMLGKIFESLLDVEERKSKGAFYTPREIVHYMCQECLINYIHNDTNIDKTSLEILIKYGDIIKDTDIRTVRKENYKMPKIIIDNLIEIDNLLSNVTVADPSVGSGAFPLGMLNEIVKVRGILTEYISKDKELSEAYFFKKERSSYNLKKHAMRKSIFAVDIETSAVEITKLRLWLSLVVDADDKIVNTLPNLDYNIMTGNSLVDELYGIKLFDKEALKKIDSNSLKKRENSSQIEIFINGQTFKIGVAQQKEMLEEIHTLQNSLYDEKDNKKKRDIKEKIEKIEWELIEYQFNRDGRKEKLKEFKLLQREKRKPYFIWEREFFKIFEKKGGFDIVIGNPPYVGEKGNKHIFRPIADTEFGQKFYQGKMDLFYFFFHLGLNLAKEKGIIGYITTNYYITATGGKKLRTDIKNRSDLLLLLNFNELKVFESARGQHNIITIMQKGKSNEMCISINIDEKGNADSIKLNSILNKIDSNIEVLLLKQDSIFEGYENYIRPKGSNFDNLLNCSEEFANLNSILRKIGHSEYNLGKICNIKQGIVSGADKVTDSHIRKYGGDWTKGEGIFVLSKEELDNLKLNEQELNIVKKFYKNSQVDKYQIKENNDANIIYITKDINITDVPNIINHLEKYKAIISQKRETMQGKLPWYCLHWSRDKEILESDEKIVNPRRCKSNKFALETDKRYEQSDLMISVLKESYKSKFITKYILAFLNSKLCRIWLLNKGKMKGGYDGVVWSSSF